MKLTLHSNSNETPASIQFTSDFTERSKMQLIYRGNTFYYTPRPVLISQEIETDRSTVTLIYRGNTYERKLLAPKRDRKPRAINWRWQ